MYESYFLNRTSSRGGRISVLAKPSLECELLSEFSCIFNYEVLPVKIDKITLTEVYRPSDGCPRDIFFLLGGVSDVYEL